MFINKITDFYRKFEIYISFITFSFGLITTFLTLTRVDMLMENIWIILNLIFATAGILALTYFENRNKKEDSLTSKIEIHFYLTLFIQFAFGGLFATYFVFYLRSSSLSDSWFFLLTLLILLVGNEIWKKHYQRLTFQISVLFVSLYLFFIFLLPVLFHRLGADLFLISGLLALLIIFLFTLLLKKIALEKFKNSHKLLQKSIVIIFLLINIMYFTNIIPPIPLALKADGVYHHITKLSNGNYEALGESKKWFDYFISYPVIHNKGGEAIYVFSAIFSPVNFSTNIVHEWQYYDEREKEWIVSSRIILPINGGRENGYRTYSLKRNLEPGLWRVRVMTPANQVLGRVKFRVRDIVDSIPLVTKLL